MEDCSSGIDFIELLGRDLSIKILQCLDNPSDLVRVSAVSTSWYRIVIENSLCKHLCLQMFPQLSSVSSLQIRSSIAITDASVEEHTIYSSLAHGLTSSKRKRLLMDAICTSSTDHNYEGIENTLLPGDRVEGIPSYWSSRGESNSQVPETLVYKLISDLCVVTEILVQPHQGYYEVEFGCPIYSAEAVRFRLGRLKFPPDQGGHFMTNQIPSADNFVWTYTSPVFPMIQTKGLQRFVLPEPVLCIGGIMQIELLGRIIRHPLDGLYYICISHVQPLGRHLRPRFDVDILDESGRCTLKYNPGAESYSFPIN